MGIVLIIYTLGFFFISYGSWNMMMQQKGHPPLSNGAFLYFIVLCITSILTVMTYIIRQLIMKKEIVINFWTFIPVIIYGLIYYIFLII